MIKLLPANNNFSLTLVLWRYCWRQSETGVQRWKIVRQRLIQKISCSCKKRPRSTKSSCKNMCGHLHLWWARLLTSAVISNFYPNSLKVKSLSCKRQFVTTVRSFWVYQDAVSMKWSKIKPKLTESKCFLKTRKQWNKRLCGRNAPTKSFNVNWTKKFSKQPWLPEDPNKKTSPRMKKSSKKKLEMSHSKTNYLSACAVKLTCSPPKHRSKIKWPLYTKKKRSKKWPSKYLLHW